MKRADRGRFVAKLTDEQYEEALNCIAEGETIVAVAEAFGVSRAAFNVKAHADEEFRRRLAIANEIGAWSRLGIAEDMLRGGSYSTGSVERDKAYADFSKWLASKTNRAVFGDKLQVETTQIMYAVPAPEFDATVVEVTAEADPDPED